MGKSWLMNLAAAIVFYTRLPLPTAWLGNFQTVARFAPLVGVLLGGLLAGLEWIFAIAGMPSLTRSTLLVVLWIAVTGGLHLDGAIDTADGLAVPQADRRLAVMADSTTGAFGVMAGIAIVVLKIAALSDLTRWRGLIFVLALGWGRWGQQVAIARYPYLKATGKGAFHKSAIRSSRDLWPSLLLLTLLSLLPGLIGHNWIWSAIALSGSLIAPLTAAALHRSLGGHTGDTYGATVEWTEALWLVAMTMSNRSVG